MGEEQQMAILLLLGPARRLNSPTARLSLPGRAVRHVLQAASSLPSSAWSGH